ncbi:hypothetical protein ACFVJM_32230 [Streptomyces virginiae]
MGPPDQPEAALRDGREGLERRFEVESTTMPSRVTHLAFTRRPRQFG